MLIKFLETWFFVKELFVSRILFSIKHIIYLTYLFITFFFSDVYTIWYRFRKIYTLISIYVASSIFFLNCSAILRYPVYITDDTIHTRQPCILWCTLWFSHNRSTRSTVYCRTHDMHSRARRCTALTLHVFICTFELSYAIARVLDGRGTSASRENERNVSSRCIQQKLL